MQADRLSRYFAGRGVRFTTILSSDLQRAIKTANIIRYHQLTEGKEGSRLIVQQLPVLREQDFGYYEGKSFKARQRGSNKSGKEAHREAHLDDERFQDVESKESMETRANSFLDLHLLPLVRSASQIREPVIALVSHGIFLAILWRCLLRRFPERSVKLAPGLSIIAGAPTTLEYLGGWSNTGYLELEIRSSPLANAIDVIDTIQNLDAPPDEDPVTQLSSLLGWTMAVKTVNGKDHLKDLKRTGGGVGSSKHDDSQKRLDTFFAPKRRKIGLRQNIVSVWMPSVSSLSLTKPRPLANCDIVA